MKFRLRQNADGEWWFVLKAKNGETICVSQMYEDEQAARKGIWSVRVNAPFAPVVNDYA